MLHCLRCFLHHFYVLEGKALKVSLFVQEEDNQTMNDDDAELMKRLRKQNRRVIASVRGGRKAVASRNSYKDKGGKSSHNSKMQKQLSGW
jgi:RIO kinase 2